MNSRDSLLLLKEQLSEEAFKSIEKVIILELFDRPDLIDDISRALTGKTTGQHIKTGLSKLTKYAGNKLKERILKSDVIKNTFGKKEYEKAFKDLNDAEIKYNQAKKQQNGTSEPALRRVQKENVKQCNKEANKRAKRVNEIKQKYGF